MGVTTFFYSIWLGAFVSVVLMVVHKKDYNLKSEIPFTPFIIIAALFVLYTNSDILSLYEFII
jgi:prepilin signal peptidase PulO-like enzyme (type II secretory pathway)